MISGVGACTPAGRPCGLGILQSATSTGSNRDRQGFEQGQGPPFLPELTSRLAGAPRNWLGRFQIPTFAICWELSDTVACRVHSGHEMLWELFGNAGSAWISAVVFAMQESRYTVRLSLANFIRLRSGQWNSRHIVRDIQTNAPVVILSTLGACLDGTWSDEQGSLKDIEAGRSEVHRLLCYLDL